jgi:hypothetical protein
MGLTTYRDTFYDEQIRALERLEKELLLRIETEGEGPDVNRRTVERLRELLQHYRGVAEGHSSTSS